MTVAPWNDGTGTFCTSFEMTPTALLAANEPSASKVALLNGLAPSTPSVSVSIQTVGSVALSVKVFCAEIYSEKVASALIASLVIVRSTP